MLRVSHIFPLSERPGRVVLAGAENHLLSLLPALQRRGVEVELIVLLFDSGPLITTTLENLAREGIKISVVARNPEKSRFFNLLSLREKLFLLLRSRRERIIHAHLDFGALVEIVRLSGCAKIVFSIHNDEPYFNRLPWRYEFRLNKHLVSHYIAISDSVRHYFMSVARVNPEKITTVHYGIQPLSMQNNCRQLYGLAQDDFVVGFIGRLTRQKNVRVLLEAFSRLPDVKGVIVGDGELRGELEDFASRQGLKNVLFTGAINAAATLMPMFDLLCLPSLWEGLGLVLLEAMLQRVPIIGSRSGAIPEVLGQGKYGLLFDPHDPESLAAAIAQARSDSPMMRQLANRAFHYADNRFSLEGMVSKTIDIYRHIEETWTR